MDVIWEYENLRVAVDVIAGFGAAGISNGSQRRYLPIFGHPEFLTEAVAAIYGYFP
ncbi:hypothetical protein D3C75_863060 [compost metagenome]